MHRPDCPQPASSLIPLALSERKVFKCLSKPKEPTKVIGVNNCSDRFIIYNKREEIERVTGCKVQPVDCFGSFIRIADTLVSVIFYFLICPTPPKPFSCTASITASSTKRSTL